MMSPRNITSAHSIDIALCSVDEAAFHAALHARRKLLGEEKPDYRITRYSRLWRLRAPPTAADPERYQEEVERLAERFSDERYRTPSSLCHADSQAWAYGQPG